MNLHAWFVTLQISPQHTRDVLVRARNTWHARWLCGITHPNIPILHVRPARR